jgi:hypothetical protein
MAVVSGRTRWGGGEDEVGESWEGLFEHGGSASSRARGARATVRFEESQGESQGGRPAGMRTVASSTSLVLTPICKDLLEFERLPALCRSVDIHRASR